ncbi:diguanylate cyclase domain protein [Acetobacteraceae bacterium AT-5844]|nr:diguanylate cyclase domain protein [Acetobacteraceae bacterium AT-5844]
MLFDLRTIYAILAITFLLLGFVQLAAFLSGRFVRWALHWALSNLLLGLGCGVLTLGDDWPNLLTYGLGDTLIIIGGVLLVVGVRSFAGMSTHWGRYAAVPASVTAFVLAWASGPDELHLRSALISCFFALLDIMTVASVIALARREDLLSGWLLACIFGITAVMFVARAAMALHGDLSDNDIFETSPLAYQWIAATASALASVRSMALLLMVAERGQRRILARAEQDALTGLLNRNGLFRRYKALCRSRPAAQLAVLMIDLDHFKAVNDTHGHKAGDAILRHFAISGQHSTREGDILARLGGDEFVILLPATSMNDALALGERLQKTFATSQPELSVQPTLSIGATTGEPSKDTLDSMLARADAALYRAKRAGRARVAA